MLYDVLLVGLSVRTALGFSDGMGSKVCRRLLPCLAEASSLSL